MERRSLTLTLVMTEEADVLRGRFEYNTDLFDTVTVRRMADHFTRLLEGIVANTQRRISEYPLLSEDERHQQLVEWNNTNDDYDGA